MNMDAEVSTEGFDTIHARMKGLGKVTQAVAEKVAEGARNNIRNGSHTGRFYDRGGQLHEASAQGEAPASESGELLASITVRTGAVADGASDQEVVASKPYAPILEEELDRPFLFPALLAQRDNFLKALARLFEI